MSFIDDAKRKIWVYCISKTYDVFDTFQKWKVLVENYTGTKVKCLKSDNGGEYYSKDFDNYFSFNRIRSIKVIPITP